MKPNLLLYICASAIALAAILIFGNRIVTKFGHLNDSLAEFTEESQSKSDSLIHAIETKIEDKRMGKTAHQVGVLSTNTIAYIESVKNALIEGTGGYGPDGKSPAGMKNTDFTKQYFIDHPENGKALEDSLDIYINRMNELYREVILETDYYRLEEMISENDYAKADEAIWSQVDRQLYFINPDSTSVPIYEDTLGLIYRTQFFPTLTADGREHPLFKNDPDQSQMTWVELSFDQTPMIAALAHLTEKQAQIATCQKTLLQLIEKSNAAAATN